MAAVPPMIVDVQEQTIEPKRLVVKCGTLIVDVDETSYGTVHIDGKELSVMEINISLRPGETPEVLAKVYVGTGPVEPNPDVVR